MRVLVVGTTGMLGSAMFRTLSTYESLDVSGTARSEEAKAFFDESIRSKIICGVDVEKDWDSVVAAVDHVEADVIINCVGVVKQLKSASDPLVTVPINTLLPHKLAQLARRNGGRLVHVSTDCVFSGTKGMYKETDTADARDLYGLSKYLGEVGGPGCITLRTSIIGHEFKSANGLVEWFLSQSNAVKGYARAVFSGFPTCELSRIVGDFVLPQPDLDGLYQVASEPINKYDLLTLVASVYGKDTSIVRDDTVVIDRSLDGTRFNAATGYVPPSWPDLVEKMRRFG